ncbi:Gfo/Idh/MocA family oxidoreductase [bacterium]|nr:Gfo/Idh/MocA family oxidoreductase [bacterium]
MPLRVAIVGLGIGKTHVQLFQDNPAAELVAVCDVNEAAAREQADKAGARAYTSYEQMLEEAPLDAVSLCTPPKLHAPMTEQAAARGLHVLCEKPMAPTLADCQRMIDACQAAGVTLMIALKKRFASHYGFVKDQCDGEAGTPLYACARFALGRVEHDWFWDDADGGGPILENSVHIVDILRYLMGNVVRVSAEGGNLFMKHRAPVADCAAVTLRFASGGIAALALGYGCEWSMAREEVLLATPKMVFELQGGFDRADQLRYTSRENPADVQQRPAEQPYGGGFPEEIAHFIECATRGQAPRADGLAGREAVRICLAIKESIRTGKPVELGTDWVFGG